MCMKKVFYLIVFMLIFRSTYGQNLNINSDFIQQCVNLNELRDFYNLDFSGVPVHIYVIKDNIKLQTDETIFAMLKEVEFVSQSELKEKKVDSYITFKYFNIKENNANVEFCFNSDLQNNKKIIYFNLLFRKIDNKWEVYCKNIRK